MNMQRDAQRSIEECYGPAEGYVRITDGHIVILISAIFRDYNFQAPNTLISSCGVFELVDLGVRR